MRAPFLLLTASNAHSYTSMQSFAAFRQQEAIGSWRSFLRSNMPSELLPLSSNNQAAAKCGRFLQTTFDGPLADSLKGWGMKCSESANGDSSGAVHEEPEVAATQPTLPAHSCAEAPLAVRTPCVAASHPFTSDQFTVCTNYEACSINSFVPSEDNGAHDSFPQVPAIKATDTSLPEGTAPVLILPGHEQAKPISSAERTKKEVRCDSRRYQQMSDVLLSLGNSVRPDYGQPGDVVAGVHNARIRAMDFHALKVAVENNNLVEWVADGAPTSPNLVHERLNRKCNGLGCNKASGAGQVRQKGGEVVLDHESMHLFKVCNMTCKRLTCCPST
jgi:hypothetical protein